TNTKSELELRNAAIYEDYKAGMSVKQLAEKYFLVEKSIQRIINKQKSKK
ncbi:MAG TPA: Mor transcription activator family protein, partial [Lachnospiraceae bacterium]|nr:Mor transcription activator family protein [Lachnospiraceae bacterium]